MMFEIGISNILGVEAWNSYNTNFNRAVDIYVTADLSMTLTNQYGFRLSLPPLSTLRTGF